MTEDFEKMSHRADLLQRKYTEQKAQTSSLQRAKLTVEGLKRQAEMKADELTKELEKKSLEMAAQEKKVGTNVKTLEVRIDDLNTKINEWKEKYNALSEDNRKARKTIAERDATIAKMGDNISQVESDLQFATRTRDRYLEHNHQMAATAQSILARYDENGVFADTILHVEPFTPNKKGETGEADPGIPRQD